MNQVPSSTEDSHATFKMVFGSHVRAHVNLILTSLDSQSLKSEHSKYNYFTNILKV